MNYSRIAGQGKGDLLPNGSYGDPLTGLPIGNVPNYSPVGPMTLHSSRPNTGGGRGVLDTVSTWLGFGQNVANDAAAAQNGNLNADGTTGFWTKQNQWIAGISGGVLLLLIGILLMSKNKRRPKTKVVKRYSKRF